MHQRQRPIRAGLFADAQQIRKPHPWVNAVAGMQPPAAKRHHGMTQRLGIDGGDAAMTGNGTNDRRGGKMAVGIFQQIGRATLRHAQPASAVQGPSLATTVDGKAKKRRGVPRLF